MTDDEPTRPAWEVALARVEGKIDTMVELATRMQVTVTDLDRRVRDVETSMARVKQQLSEIERHEANRPTRRCVRPSPPSRPTRMKRKTFSDTPEACFPRFGC